MEILNLHYITYRAKAQYSRKEDFAKDKGHKDLIMKVKDCKSKQSMTRSKFVRSHSEPEHIGITIPVATDVILDVNALDITSLKRKNKADIISLPEPLVAPYQATTPVFSVWSTNVQSLYKKSTMTRMTYPRGLKA